MFLDENDLIREREETITEMKPIFLRYLISRCRITIDNRELKQVRFEITINRHDIITLFCVHYGNSSKLSRDIANELWDESFSPFCQFFTEKGYIVKWSGRPFSVEKVGKITLIAKEER